jgi:hypothetical protein
MKYGQKRDYRKIDIFCIHEDKHGTDRFLNTYVCSTTWARNLRIASENAAQSLGVDISRIVAHYA